MSCSKDLIETYGDPHLHTGDSPIPLHEAEMHDCPGSCYFGDQWEQVQRSVESLNQGPMARNHSPDPNVRYGPQVDVSQYEVGTGCMNTRCVAPNCHGSVLCPKKPDYDQLEPNLFPKQKVIEPFGASVQFGFKLEDGTLNYLLLALAALALWYFLSRR
jgi:hypothetical protein